MPLRHTKKQARPRLLKLTHQQITDHLATRDVGGAPESVEVEGAGERVGIAEEEHGWNPAARILHGEAVLGDAILLDLAAPHPVHTARRVHFTLVLAGHVRPLLARQDVEVVVGRVPTRVALGADSGA